MGIDITDGDFLTMRLTFDQCLNLLKDNKIKPSKYMMTVCKDDYHIDIRVARRVVAGLYNQDMISIKTFPQKGINPPSNELISSRDI